MGLGGTAKKLQNVIDAAEQLYAKMNEVIGEVSELRSEVEATSEQIDRIERELAEQRALIEGISESSDVDVAELLADVSYPEPPEMDGGEDETETDSGDSSADTATSE